jgi:PRMT5 TIM barrel domain
MPLSDRQDYEDAKYVGLAVVSCESLTEKLHNISVASGFDFLATPLANTLEPRLESGAACERIAFARQDMISLNGERAGSRLLGLLSGWIDPDSEDVRYRDASQAAFRAEVEWAKFLGLQAIALPPPHNTSKPAGYAQVRASMPLFAAGSAW